MHKPLPWSEEGTFVAQDVGCIWMCEEYDPGPVLVISSSDAGLPHYACIVSVENFVRKNLCPAINPCFHDSKIVSELSYESLLDSRYRQVILSVHTHTFKLID